MSPGRVTSKKKKKRKKNSISGFTKLQLIFFIAKSIKGRIKSKC